MKKLMIIICSLFLCVALQAQNKDIVNLWEYSAPDAPYGYEKGTFLIKEKDGKLTGEVKIQEYTAAIKEIKKEKEGYTCSLYIDGQAIDITLKLKGKNELEGQATGGGMDIPFTCKPAKK
ncbi:hypothetical protein [Massilibacteroides sp.]|uniref:hypothetical protein n=1 Tax=Massilibacteroides sp. TaxID=2034766 RepID=UPI0026100AFD|nr:hypothetical protein [Massilibacteroides sp.]MDD4513987.1 hypothetical protein [Massilibacteroides sp.]